MEIFNSWNQCEAAGGDRILISYQSRDSRSMRSPGWRVVRIEDGAEILTDPGGHWMHYGRKFFPLFGTGQTRAQVLADAIKWANEKYGPREFVGNRSRDYVEKEVNKKFPIPKRA